MSTLSFHGSNAGDRLLGPYFLPPCLTGAVYHNFLQNFSPVLLQDVDLWARIHSRFIHDCAAPHFLLEVQEFWKSMFPQQWKGCSGPTTTELVLLL
jgi:hypothetical protein